MEDKLTRLVPHKVTVRNRTPGMPLSGNNCEFLLDGQKVKAVKSIKIEVGARDLGVVTIEMFADVDFEAEIGSLVKHIHKGTDNA